MLKLEREPLKVYCKSVLELEISKYSSLRAKETIEKLLASSRPIRDIVPPPDKVNCSPPPAPPKKPVLDEIPLSAFTVPLILLIVAVTVSVVCFILFLKASPEYQEYLRVLLAPPIALAVIMGSRIISKRTLIKKNQIKYRNDVQDYGNALQNYENEKIAYASYVQKCEQYNKALNNSHLQKQAEADAEFEKRGKAYTQLIEEAEQLSITLGKTTLLLKDLYEKDVIYPKYRALVAMAEIYEYLDSDRCSTLEGTDGAYNLYEEEVRLNYIVTQIDKVIQNLTHIVENQYLLYTRLTEVNATLNHMTHDITVTLNEIKGLKANSDELLGSSTISSYCFKQIAENTESINRLVAAGVCEK